MEFSWTTFTLEIINFLVLIWILKRFLYQPVLDVITRRRERVERTLQEAHKLREDALSMRSDYTHRLSAWEQEKTEARDALRKELQEEREKRLARLVDDIEKERDRLNVLREREREDRQRHTELIALEQGAKFTSRLLQRLACPELQNRMLRVLQEDITGLSDEKRDGLRSALHDGDLVVHVASAYPLDGTARQAVRDILASIHPDLSAHCEFSEDQSLLAGVRITAGPWVLDANIRDELRLFTEAHHAGLP